MQIECEICTVCSGLSVLIFRFFCSHLYKINFIHIFFHKFMAYFLKQKVKTFLGGGKGMGQGRGVGRGVGEWGGGRRRRWRVAEIGNPDQTPLYSVYSRSTLFANTLIMRGSMGYCFQILWHFMYL